MMHGRGDAAEDIAKAALAAVAHLDEDRTRLYTDLVFISLSAALRSALMAPGTYEYQSDFAKKYFGQGEARGRAQAVLAVLSARGVDVDPSARERVLACTDLTTLDTWLARAANASAVSDVLTG